LIGESLEYEFDEKSHLKLNTKDILQEAGVSRLVAVDLDMAADTVNS